MIIKNIDIYTSYFKYTNTKIFCKLCNSFLNSKVYDSIFSCNCQNNGLFACYESNILVSFYDMLHIIISEDKIYYGNSFDFNQNERYFYFKENSLLGKFDFVFDFLENEELKKKISTIENNLLFL